jgi:hypothetical protein
MTDDRAAVSPTYTNDTRQADVTRAMGTENTLQGKTIQNLIIQLMAMPGTCRSVNRVSCGCLISLLMSFVRLMKLMGQVTAS